MATVVKSTTGKTILYVKGAPEIIFGMCKNTAGVTKAEIDAQLFNNPWRASSLRDRR